MRRFEALAQCLMMFGPIVLASLLGLASMVPRGTILVTLALYGLGLALFLSAKLSVLRQGIRISFGTKHMNPKERRLYLCGYGLMGIGLLLTLGMLLAARKT